LFLSGNGNTLPLSIRGEEKALDAALCTIEILKGFYFDFFIYLF